ncbi:hypothetical protein CLU96_3207 [Chryseobacterium sp. 52]|uniref:hypothetical protein n=1 Tax=Chryseobacterium sp. 52 TaxID=2035213 RepID=UPI000C40FF05|nr:hypothetical protein [Chryseobacterium sp. 52]PIF46184.1 hypothetical protein CLU96_3207 [Chryseobacterium sp. 52]
MKKMILLAAFGVAGLMGAKETVENKVESNSAKAVFQLCGVIVTYYNSQNEVIDQKWFTSEQPDLTSCMAYQAGVIANLRSQGYNVKSQAEEASTDVN